MITAVGALVDEARPFILKAEVTLVGPQSQLGLPTSYGKVVVPLWGHKGGCPPGVAAWEPLWTDTCWGGQLGENRFEEAPQGRASSPSKAVSELVRTSIMPARLKECKKNVHSQGKFL